MKPIIRVENLSKQYKIGAQQKPYSTLRESLTDAVRSPFKSLGRKDNGASEKKSFWALKDVNFEVFPGEVVGIIGRNGAGKSTLLKILSRITEPTTGKIELYGRVGSLLEVGTGFHQELTGRENIFLNGAILGMKREEIAKKFDEIVDFAEVEDFLETPVKHYSSGMYMRLAFAVAANLEPEVLIVDEVLAVGDAQFQKKCLGKMRDVSSYGRTVLFVSHNIQAIQQLCNSCLLLKGGEVVMYGDTVDVVQQYVKQQPTQNKFSMSKVKIESIRVLDEAGKETNLLNYGGKIVIEISMSVYGELKNPAVDIAFYNNKTRLFALQSDKLTTSDNISQGSWIVLFEIAETRLVAEDIHFDVGIREEGEPYFLILEEVKKLMPNYGSIPEEALTDCILYPKTKCLSKTVSNRK